MHPAKLWAALKKAALQSVISNPVRRRSREIRSPAFAAWHCRNKSTAERVQTAQWPKRAPNDPPLYDLAVDLEGVRSNEVRHDIVIVARVEGDVSPRLSHSADCIQRLVTVEGCNLDGHNIVDFGELAPECVGKCSTSHRRLQVEPHDG